MKKKILILCTELSIYTVNCLNFYSQNNNDVEMHVIHFRINKEAPFVFDINNEIFCLDKEEINVLDYAKKIKPDLILCSGWIDKEYLKIIRKFKKKNIKTVLVFDNYWEGTFKQYLGVFLISLIVKKHFDYCWVPGELHKSYAIKIGFNKNQIYDGFYATDLDFFRKAYEENKSLKENNYPKKFLYVGRYLKLKGIRDLWDAFDQFVEKNPDWELHCIGTGELFQNKKTHKKIIHHGFLQQSQFKNIIKETGVFIMPSHYDHWGVAVQEFSAAGFPLICSDKVGSNCAFLKDGKNGFEFQSGNVDDLLEKMNKISKLSNNKFIEYGKVSHELSNLYNLSTWNFTLNKILYNSI